MEKNLEDLSEKELGIYVIKRLFEMGYSEKQIGNILRFSLELSIIDILCERNQSAE